MHADLLRESLLQDTDMDTTCQISLVVDVALLLFANHVIGVIQRSTAADPRDAFGDG